MEKDPSRRTSCSERITSSECFSMVSTEHMRAVLGSPTYSCESPLKRKRYGSYCVAIAIRLSLCITYAFALRSPVLLTRRHASTRHQIRGIQSESYLSVDDLSPKTTTTPPATKMNRTQDVRFLSPLLEYGYISAVEEHENGTLANKPLLLYLPGFDGTFLSPFLQFPELHTLFDVRCMTIGTEDRSTFSELSDTVIQYLQSELVNLPNDTNLTTLSDSQGTASSIASTSNILFNLFGGGRKEERPTQKRPVYLAGESFGGILAIDVVHRLLSDDFKLASFDVLGLTLINPATCFDRSRLAAEGPSVAELPAWLYPFGLMRLLPLFADDYSLPQLGLILTAKALPSVIDNPEREAYMGRVALSLPFVLPLMKQPTLKWRLSEWLSVGCDRVANTLYQSGSKLDIPVLIVAGEKDGTLPSIAEAERLAGILPDVSVHVVEGAGHASTCGSRVDLAALFRQRFKNLTSRGFVRSRPVSTDQRTVMKEIAAAGKGAYFGMEPRYDNASIGLSPLLYWSKLYWKDTNTSHILT